MSKSTAPVAAKTPVAATTSAKTPVVVTNEDGVVNFLITNENRSRPVVAINEEGKLVICCKTTAKKHGWEVQGKLYVRTRSGKSAAINTKGELVAAAVALAPEAKAVTPRAPARRAADAKVQAAAKKVAAVLHTVEELLK
jgi:hypothetical protein